MYCPRRSQKRTLTYAQGENIGMLMLRIWGETRNNDKAYTTLYYITHPHIHNAIPECFRRMPNASSIFDRLHMQSNMFSH